MLGVDHVAHDPPAPALLVPPEHGETDEGIPSIDRQRRPGWLEIRLGKGIEIRRDEVHLLRRDHQPDNRREVLPRHRPEDDIHRTAPSRIGPISRAVFANHTALRASLACREGNRRWGVAVSHGTGAEEDAAVRESEGNDPPRCPRPPSMLFLLFLLLALPLRRQRRRGATRWRLGATRRWW